MDLHGFVNAPDQLTRIKDYGRGLVEVRYKFCTWHANTMHLMVFILIIVFYMYSIKNWNGGHI